MKEAYILGAESAEVSEAQKKSRVFFLFFFAASEKAIEFLHPWHFETQSESSARQHKTMHKVHPKHSVSQEMFDNLKNTLKASFSRMPDATQNRDVHQSSTNKSRQH